MTNPAQHTQYRSGNRIIRFLKRVFRLWRKLEAGKVSYTPVYRIVNIEQEVSGEYIVEVQLIGKSSLIRTAPEKLLADDDTVKNFSPIDVRTLTYLGYLGINSPKYKILAQRLSEENDQMLFAVHKKGEKKFKVVSASEISADQEIIQGLSQQEAHMVGFTTATEQTGVEQKQKELAKQQLLQEQSKKISD